ncbi:MAG: hypothetical protein JWN72_2971, partial [Thermoleophilia bacterium]|nr:hypothetical protein [Thermoleophilia bacterium]
MIRGLCVLSCAFVALLAAPTTSLAATGTTSVGIVDVFSADDFRVLGDSDDNDVVIHYDNGVLPVHDDDTIAVSVGAAGGELGLNDPSHLCTISSDHLVVTCPMTNTVSTWTIDGQAGNDTLRLTGDAHGADTPGSGEDYDVSMYGGPGNDVIYGSNGVENLYGDRGQDVSGAPGSDGNDEIHDGLGFRPAGERAEVVYGDAGNDTLVQPALSGQNPTNDQDTIDLGAGTDTVSYAARDADHPVRVSIAQDAPITNSYDDGTLA